MALRAVVDEARLEARLDAGDDRFVDVALALLLAGGFDVEIDELLAVDDGHPKLLGLGGIEQHALHDCFPGAGPAGREAGETEPRGSARGVTLSCGGRLRCRPRAQQSLRYDESGPDARRCGRGVGLDRGEGLRSRDCDGLHQCVQAVRHQSCPRREGLAGAVRPAAEFVAKCAAQCAASNRTHAGCGDCALHLPSLLLRGATPGRSVDLTGGRFMPKRRRPSLPRESQSLRSARRGARHPRCPKSPPTAAISDRGGPLRAAG